MILQNPYLKLNIRQTSRAQKERKIHLTDLCCSSIVWLLLEICAGVRYNVVVKLEIELVPDSCWYSNLRSILSPAQWDILRKRAYARAGGKCMICGAPAKRLEAHERWSYDEANCVQKLTDIVAVCRACHEVIHLGRTTLMGREREACEHFMKVNGCTYAEYRKAVAEANETHRRRNAVKEWSLDLTALKKF